MKRIRWILLALACGTALLDSGTAQKLLIISIDGCRPDALLKADAPNIRALADSGIYTWWALSRPPTKSGPCWSSIFTGVWNDKHGVTDNTFANSKFDSYSMLFSRLKNADPSFYSGWFVYWPDLGTRTPHGADVTDGDWSDANTLSRALALLSDERTDALFVHFGAVDAVGHSSDFDPDSPAYIDAIHTADGRIGQVIAAMKSRPNYPNEHWMTIALTDHGGYTTHHGGSTIEEMRTFFIVTGENVPRREIPHEWQQKSFRVPPYGVQLNGSGDYITIPDRSEYHFGAGQDFTVELSVRTAGWSGTPVLFANKDMRSGKNPGFAFSLIDEGKWQANIADGTSQKNISGPIIADERWHQITAVFRRNGMLTLFQDGIKTGAIDMSGIGNIDTPYGFVIGQDGTISRSAFVQAGINEVRVWKTALPDSVVQKRIFTPVTTEHPSYPDLLGYWKMNDGAGTSIADSSLRANNGTFIGTNPVWIVPDDTVETLEFDSCKAAKSVDLTATVLAHFGIGIRPEWNLDGTNLVPSESPDAIHQSPVSGVITPSLDIYPNPSNPSATIEFELPKPGAITLMIFDVLGRNVATLASGSYPSGRFKSVRNPRSLPSGVYYVRLQAGNTVQTKKLVLLK